MTELWVSVCGRYYALRCAVRHQPAFDVIEVATGTTWLWPRYEPTWGDTDRRHTHAEFSRMVTGWSNRGRRMPRADRWIEAFELTFAECDTAIRIKPFTGNVLIARHEAEFRRRIPAVHTRKHASAAAAVVREIEAQRA